MVDGSGRPSHSLGSLPAYRHIDIDEDGEIVGLS
jgi:formyltetrahydrofolate synthetase